MFLAEERRAETCAVPQDGYHLLCAVYPGGTAELVCHGHQVSSHHQPHRLRSPSRHESGR